MKIKEIQELRKEVQKIREAVDMQLLGLIKQLRDAEAELDSGKPDFSCFLGSDK